MAKKSYNEYFQGKGKWIKVNIPDPKFRKWSMQLYPNDQSLDKFRKLQEEGLLTRLRKDEEGYHFILSRHQSKVMKGELVTFGPPRLLDKDGSVLENNLKIGDGSDCTAKVQVYYYNKPTGGQGVAMRWEALKVDNLVPYPIDDLPPHELEQVQGLKEQPPEQLW
jgi:hypothetical protein